MKLVLILLGLISVSCSQTGSYNYKNNLENIANGRHRSPKNIARNIYRHPIETLHFFEVEPNMKVAEVSPGGGWYTEILGPYLKKEGDLYLAIFSDDSKRSYAPRLNKKIKKLISDQSLFGKISFTTMEAPDHIGPIAPENSMDRVLTFRNLHSWMKDRKLAKALKAFYQALKPGGLLGIVEHRAKTNRKQDPDSKSGYVREDYVIQLAEALSLIHI